MKSPNPHSPSQNNHPQSLQIHFKANQTDVLPIRSERQYRLILAILEIPMATNKLIPIVGANNVPDVVKKLRSCGWNITTLEQNVITRDGEKATAGTYQLGTPIEIAKASLWAWRAKHPLK